MRTRSRVWPLAAAAVLASACSGGGDDASGMPDADLADAIPACATVPPAEDFDLRFGVTGESGDFDELLDGDQCPIRLGNQGILMLIGELRASMPAGPTSMCCTADVTPSGDFAGKNETTRFPVADQGDELSAPTLTLLAGRDKYDTLDGAEVTVTWSCAAGDGTAGTVMRSVQFYVVE